MDQEPERQPTSRKLRYSDTDKSDALVVIEAEGGSPYRASQVTGIPLATLYDWKHGRGIPQDVKERAHEATERLASGFQDLAERLVADALGNQERIDRANIQQVVTAAAISVEKMRLLRDQATSIHAQQLSDEERLARLNELLATALTLPEQQEPEQMALGSGADEEQPAPDADEDAAPAS